MGKYLQGEKLEDEWQKAEYDINKRINTEDQKATGKAGAGQNISVPRNSSRSNGKADKKMNKNQTKNKIKRKPNLLTSLQCYYG